MSGLCGFYRADGREADRELLARVAARLTRRGPDGGGERVDGPIGLAHRAHATVPEWTRDKQPAVDDAALRWLVWDGRLDERDALATSLGLSGATDAELVLAAYRRWGGDGVRRLRGDFAFALWDGEARRLVCARDALGVKPLYYHWDGRRLLLASSITALFEDPAIARRPDEATIADFLLGAQRDPHATPYEGIRQVPAAHTLIVERGAPRLARYWDAADVPEVRYRRDDDYLDDFCARFVEAVRGRLRSAGPVAIMLSGGIDSTVMTEVAARLGREVGAPDLAAFTVMIDGLLEEDDDAIRRVEAAYGLTVHRSAIGRDRTFLEATLAVGETPCADGLVRPPFDAIRERGCAVVLTGFGADELGRAAERGYLEDVLLRRPWRFAVEARRRLDAYGHATTSWRRELAWRSWALLPPRARCLVKRLARRQVPAWLEPSFARRVDAARWTPPSVGAPWRTRTARASWHELTRPAMAVVLDHMDGVGAEASIECRYPYLDRCLVELWLGTPPGVKLRDGYRKRFVQRALAPLTAGPPRAREGVAERVPVRNDPAFHASAAQALAPLTRDDARIHRYVCRAAIRERLAASAAGAGGIVWVWLTLELWLRRAFDAQGAA